LIPTFNKQIFHCCVQKTASQWFKFILNLDILQKASKLSSYYPYHEKFNRSDNIFRSNSYEECPKNSIISPLYIDYDTFYRIPKPKNYRAFFVTRDPRDILISWYFSTKYSHGQDGYIDNYISDLSRTHEIEEGLLYSIDALSEFGLWKTIESWKTSYSPNNDMIVNFEDLTGENQLEHWIKLLDFIEIQMDTPKLESLLNTYNFEFWSKGRKKGEEDKKSHMRKGVAGDWQNYFTPLVSEKFKQIVPSFADYH